jgi:uncharacterized protein (TIGR02118 family)
MYKVIWLTKFNPEVAPEEVLRWWRGPHAELAASTPGMLRYVQSHWTHALDPDTQLEAGPPHFDGHAEHWFADRASYEAAMASPEWRRTREDGPVGFDGSSLIGGALVETVITWDAMDDGRDR